MYLIVNLVAGRGRCRKAWPKIEAELIQRGIHYQAAFTSYPGHATELARKAVLEGQRVIVTVGGDGTLTEVVNGAAPGSITLGLIPVGSGNDFARSTEIPLEISEAVEVLSEGDTIEIDLGRVGADYFINVSGVGFDAEVALTMAEKAKWLRGTTAYIYSVFRSLVTCRPAEVRLYLDGQIRTVETLLVVVANGRYFGGGMHVAPTARLDDGLFDVVVLENLSVPAFLQAFPSVFRGEHLSHPKIKVYRARKIKVEPVEKSRKLAAQAEGNFIGFAPKEFEILPLAARVLVPSAVAHVQSLSRKELALG